MKSPSGNRQSDYRLLIRFMYLSVAAAVVTIGLKMTAASVTGSVGFLSDALESVVNLVAAIIAIIALSVAARPADDNHNFGHGKAEYFSALVEGAMILLAAVLIIWTSAERLLAPQPLEEVGVGLLLTTAAAVLNLIVGVVLIRMGKKHRSVTLQADGQHLMTDVWTSIGVLVGIAAVWLTGWLWLDPVIALLVGVNILFTGYRLLRSSLSSLLSRSLPDEDLNTLKAVLDDFRGKRGVAFPPARTVRSGRHRHAFVVMAAPGDWSVSLTHGLADELEDAITTALPGTEAFIHVEPLEESSTH